MSELPAAGRTGPVVHAVTKRDRPGAGVLASRLAVPQPRRQLVDREPLLERLSTGTEGPLTLVFGPAGAGKTYLVASWVTSGRAPGPVAWVTLDGDAAAPGAFWAYVVRALQGCGVSLGEDLGLPGRAEEIDRSFLARLAAALGEQPEPTVLVLDEYDQVSSAVIDAGLDFVLRNAAPSLRLVVIGRRRPRLRLARYRVAGELTEIGPAELAFTPEETGELLRLHGVPLPAPDVEDLTERTGGWVTGLRLTALALQREAGPVGARPVPAAAGGDIADFLLSEVVDAQPAATRDLLLRTCLLDRFTVELADALTGRSDGGSVLDALARNGTFVRPVPGTTSWFEYHRLFAEALRGRLRLRRPELVPGLHRRASQWLAEHGCLTEAVAHAVAAGDWGLAAGEVVDKLAVTRLLVGLETQRFGTLFAGLPPSGPTPEADLVRAALALARFDVAACLPALDRATAGTPEVAGPRQVAFRLAIAAVRVIVSRLTADLPAAETAGAEARRLMAEVPPDRLAQHPELPALVLSSLGTMQLWGGGSRDAAEESLSAGLAAAVGPSTEQSRSNCLGQLAFVHYLRGRLRTASACAVEALELADRAGLPPEGRVPVGHLAAAAVAWEWNDLPAVCTNVELAASSVAARHDVSIAVTVALIRSRHHRARGDPAGALRVLDGVAVQRARLPHGSFVIPMLAIEESMALLDAGRADRVAPTLGVLPAGSAARRVVQARVHLALGDPQAALDALGGAGAAATGEPGLNPLIEVRARLVAARALAATGSRAGARREFEAALRSARPEGIRRPFVELAGWTRRMLAADAPSAARHGWLGAPLTGHAPARPADADEAPSLVVESLSERELEVLRLVAQPMSNGEIAEALHLSLNTVKTHLQSVYRKLAAPSRTKAVRRARALGIL